MLNTQREEEPKMVTFTRADQQVILDLLNLFGAVREDQAEAILKLKYPNATLERTVYPLITGRKINRSNGYLFSRSGKLDEKIIEAIDIMLLLGPDITQPVQKTSEIFALTFYKNREDKLWRYDVCHVAYGTESVISGQLEGENSKYRMFVFVPEKEEQMQGIKVPSEHCYVLKNNGEYEFYLYSKEGE